MVRFFIGDLGKIEDISVNPMIATVQVYCCPPYVKAKRYWSSCSRGMLSKAEQKFPREAVASSRIVVRVVYGLGTTSEQEIMILLMALRCWKKLVSSSSWFLFWQDRSTTRTNASRKRSLDIRLLIIGLSLFFVSVIKRY